MILSTQVQGFISKRLFGGESTRSPWQLPFLEARRRLGSVGELTVNEAASDALTVE